MSSVAQTEDIKMLNETFLDCLRTPGMEKKAYDAANDFIRFRVREDGFLRKWMPPTKLENSRLIKRLQDDKPYTIGEIETDSPAAITLPFGSLPLNVYIRGKRFPIAFQRIMTPRFVKDVDELRSYDMDIRQVFSDNSLKDVLTEEDSNFVEAIETALVAPDTVVPQTNTIQWETIPGGITRETFCDALAIMPKNPTHLKPQMALINNVTVNEFMKWGRDEWGGDVSEDIAKNGWSMTKFLGVDVWVTIKRDLVPDNSMLMGADPKFLGRFHYLDDIVMYVKSEAFMIEFFSYETIGSTIANSGALARADFE